ncbi:MAG: META domain-containing protein [bacterium]
MQKIFIYLFLILLLAMSISTSNFKNKKINNPLGSSYKDATYTIDGKTVTLKDGISEIEVTSGSNSKIITKYFGNEVFYDFDSNGKEDVAFVLTQEGGGSGTFYYVVVALNTADGYAGSQAVLLGDRIAPQTTEVKKGGIIVVNYADRAQGESFVIPPSVGKSIWLLLDPKTMQFGEVAQDFEGEADSSRMKLNMKVWNWVSTTESDNKEIKPLVEKKFTLKFNDGNKFSATTDCNGVGGEYSTDGDKMSFSKMFSTQMYCEGSQEGDFSNMISRVETFKFTSKGELILGLKNSSFMVFK